MSTDTEAPPSTVEEINTKRLERARAIASAYATADEAHAHPIMMLAAAFGTAADLLHEEADAATEARKRGHQSLSKDLRNTAGRLVGIAQDLAELAKLEVHSVQEMNADSDADAAADFEAAMTNDEPDTDAVRAYLAGETDSLPAPENLAGDYHQIYSDGMAPDVPLNKSVGQHGPELINLPEGGIVSPHLVFMDPEPVTFKSKEPFPGAFEHRRSFEDLMRPVDPAGVPEHWSWSQLTSAEDCGVQHRLSRLEGVPQQPQWANIGGSAFHAVTEAFDRGAYAAGGADRLPEIHPELIAGRWAEAFIAEIETVRKTTGIEMGETGEGYRASQRGKEGYTWWVVEGERMLALYIHNRRTLDAAARKAGTLAEPLELPDLEFGLPATRPVIEWEYTRPVPGPTGVLQVHGIIDRAYRCVDGSIIVKDLKTGAGRPSSAQLGEYAWALNDLLGGNYDMVHRIRGCFYDARKGLFTDPIDLLGRPHHPHEEYVFRYHAAQAARNAGVYMPRRSDYCNSCSVKHACPVGPNGADS
jgi:hypothetical protein